MKNTFNLDPDATSRHRTLRVEALHYLGGKCVKCGFSDKRALQIDHIKGGGSKDKRPKYSFKWYRDIVAGKIGDIQLLCANCNWIKRVENHEVRVYVKYPELPEGL